MTSSSSLLSSVGRRLSINERETLLLNYLEFVEVLVDIWETFLETLSLSDFVQHLLGLGLRVSWVAVQHLPVIEHALREGLATSVRAQVSSEAYRK